MAGSEHGKVEAEIVYWCLRLLPGRYVVGDRIFSLRRPRRRCYQNDSFRQRPFGGLS
ncbi:MAG: hypothetical protein Ct9H300mP11_30700 [Chloroflexota bacterium]|nr:MAG: hypothetical protein Ct9H300mP11_30700 [Chloroflexota bacterium]